MNLIVSATVAALAGGSVIALAAGPAASPKHEQDHPRRVSIRYENLTASQPFSPSVFYAHNRSAPPLFVEGQPASFELQRIAEEGNVGPLVTEKLTKVTGGAFRGVVVGGATQPTRRYTVWIRVTREHPLISGAFMLARTNDGFSGIQGIDAYALREPVTIDLYAWDAGTENNNETGNHLIAMEGTERDPENGAIRRHEGLRGDADAPGFWKFDPAQPIGRLTITPER